MSQHPRIEEVSDSDSDPEEMDLDDFDPTHIIAPANIPPPNVPRAPPPQEILRPQLQSPKTANVDQEKYKRWQSLYPVYFDAARTRAEGRRVGKELAVENPLAREIVDAVSLLGLNVVFEPGKMHPKDWANPGRVRCLVKEEGVPKNKMVKNSELEM